MAVLEEGTQEMSDQTAVTLDRPLHVTTAKGEAVVLEPGIYEIEPILDLQLGLAKRDTRLSSCPRIRARTASQSNGPWRWCYLGSRMTNSTSCF